MCSNNTFLVIIKALIEILAGLRFIGRTNFEKANKRFKGLFDLVKNNDLKTKGKPFLMWYNSLFAPGFIIRNEVALEMF